MLMYNLHGKWPSLVLILDQNCIDKGSGDLTLFDTQIFLPSAKSYGTYLIVTTSPWAQLILTVILQVYWCW